MNYQNCVTIKDSVFFLAFCDAESKELYKGLETKGLN